MPFIDISADIALIRWVLSQDKYKNDKIVDQETLKKIDNGFRRLTWARRQYSQSLLKRFLTKSVFSVLKYRKAPSGATLYDIAKCGFEHLDAKIGAYAHDADSYIVFKPLLQSIICSINQISPKKGHPKTSDWRDIDHIDPSIDPEGKYIDKICMTVSRSIKGYAYLPAMTVSNLENLEKDIRSTLKAHSGLTGVFYSMGSMPKDVFQLLSREGIVFSDDNEFYASAGIYQNWPKGKLSKYIQ